MSRISAALLPATSEQLALVAALGQRSDGARFFRFGMPAVLLEHKGEVLSDELRTRDAAFAGSTGEHPIVPRIQAIVVAFFQGLRRSTEPAIGRAPSHLD